jgi:hypothetical protein
MTLIALSGHIGSGKDTVGQMMQYFTSPCSNPNGRYRSFQQFKENNGGSDPRYFDGHYYTDWEIKKFAGKLKEVASILTGISTHKFEDQDFKKTFLSEEWDRMVTGPYDGEQKHRMTVRELLQKVGTECMRDCLHENVWVNALFADYTQDMSGYSDRMSKEDMEELFPKWILTDCRFPNEAQAVKDRGGVVIRVERPNQEKGTHLSETALDDWSFDHVITNDGTLDELLAKVQQLMVDLKYL